MMQRLSLQEKKEINRLPKEDLHCLKSRMLYTKDVNYYLDYLKEQNEIMCMKIHGRKPSLFSNIGFITFNNTTNPKCNTTTPWCARGKNIFDMRYVFIPIHHGLHFTCAVIYMEEMKIECYNWRTDMYCPACSLSCMQGTSQKLYVNTKMSVMKHIFAPLL